MLKRNVWVGQDVALIGIGGKWHVTAIEGHWIWLVPLDEIARLFARLGENVVGFRASDLAPYQYKPGEQLP